MDIKKVALASLLLPVVLLGGCDLSGSKAHKNAAEEQRNADKRNKNADKKNRSGGQVNGQVTSSGGNTTT